MTCFWDSLRKGLNLCIDNQSLIQELKIKNKKTSENIWNNSKLNESELNENYEHVKDFNENMIYGGYDCSASDPFLHLVCDVYSVNITHNYNGYTMMYSKPGNINSVNFSSNEGHFWVTGTETHPIGTNNRYTTNYNSSNLYSTTSSVLSNSIYPRTNRPVINGGLTFPSRTTSRAAYIRNSRFYNH